MKQMSFNLSGSSSSGAFLGGLPSELNDSAGLQHTHSLLQVGKVGCCVLLFLCSLSFVNLKLRFVSHLRFKSEHVVCCCLQAHKNQLVQRMIAEQHAQAQQQLMQQQMQRSNSSNATGTSSNNNSFSNLPTTSTNFGGNNSGNKMDLGNSGGALDFEVRIHTLAMGAG